MTKRTSLANAIWTLLVTAAAGQTAPDYDAAVQKGKSQLQAASANLALAASEEAIKMNADRWEAYALAGGALMNLKRYEEAADKLSKAIERAPEAKQTTLRDLRRQCLLSESGVSPAAKEPTQEATTSQTEIVLWKTIENSSNPHDFEAYLKQYPNGAFVALAKTRLEDAERASERAQEEAVAKAKQAGVTFKINYFSLHHWDVKSGEFNVHPGGVSIRDLATGEALNITCSQMSKFRVKGGRFYFLYVGDNKPDFIGTLPKKSEGGREFNIIMPEATPGHAFYLPTEILEAVQKECPNSLAQ